jgi:hypothetical protein
MTCALPAPEAGRRPVETTDRKFNGRACADLAQALIPGCSGGKPSKQDQLHIGDEMKLLE